MNGAIRSSDIKKLEKKVSELRFKVEKATKEENRETAEKILQESQLEVPRRTGALANSGRIEESRDKVSILYGGTVNDVTGQNTSEYAIIIHEDLNLRHPNGGKAKFLQDPFLRNIEKIKKNVTKRVRSIKL